MYPITKIYVICLDFNKHNLIKQPWRYVFEISSYLTKNNFDLTILTNKNKLSNSSIINGIKIRYLNNIYSNFSFTKELERIIIEEKPDILMPILGVSSFIRVKTKLDVPIIGILTAPLYTLREVMNVGLRELLCHSGYLLTHLLGSLIPKIVIKNGSKKYDRIIVLSKRNETKLIAYGIPKEKIAIIPPGIDNVPSSPLRFEDIRQFKDKINPEQMPLILYFGSPLTLRGTDLLINSFSHINNILPSRLLILSRLDTPDLEKDEERLRKLIKRKRLENSVDIISRKLEKDELRKYILVADIICLPFKIVLSDFPLGILESMALGKLVISVDLDGIPELLEGRGYVVKPCDENELTAILIKALKKPDLSKHLGIQAYEYLQNYPDWALAGQRFLEIINNYR